MGATIRQESDGIWVLRIFGVLRKEELDAVQDVGRTALEPHGEMKLLVRVAEDFAGWVGGEAWGDVTFFVEYGDRIARIAIVGDPKWETEMRMFTGAGIRRAPVGYFPPDRIAEARAWLN
jgi:hypothetical protein